LEGAACQKDKGRIV